MSAHGGGGSERWLVSYADFITLLMVLFVVLYSMSQIDIEKYKQLSESLRAAFAGGPVRVVDPGIDQAGGIKEGEEAAPIVIPGIPQVGVDAVEVAGELTDLLNNSGVGGAVSVQNNIEGVLISLSEKLIFIQGTAEITADALPVIETIASMLLPLENDIRIIGYTDDSPSLDSRYPSNWELSVARALTIARLFEGHGIPPERITIAGRGEFHPVFPNDSPEHRAMNSRAEIIVVYPVEDNLISMDVSLDPNASGGQP